MAATAAIQGNGQILTNANNTIQGTGVIGNGSLALINGSVIDATPKGGTSTLNLNGSGNITNTATLEATAGGVLQISGNTVNNASGNITVADATSTVELVNATVQGGTLNNTGGGTFATVSTAALDGSTQGALTISTGSTYTASNNATTYLYGSIVNKGLIQLNGGNGQNGNIAIGDAVTLSGGGTVTLDTTLTSGGDAYIYGNGQTLTNTNDTIQGTGVIGDGSLALINGSVIDATPEGGTSTLNLNGSGNITNTGTLEATAGGVLADQRQHGQQRQRQHHGRRRHQHRGIGQCDRPGRHPEQRRRWNVCDGQYRGAGRQHARRPDDQHRQHLHGKQQRHDVSLRIDRQQGPDPAQWRERAERKHLRSATRSRSAAAAP